MVRIKHIKKLYGSATCRQCVNKTYRVHLLHTDCRYELIYPKKCPVCGEIKNIVTGFMLSGYFKTLFKRGKKFEIEQELSDT